MLWCEREAALPPGWAHACLHAQLPLALPLAAIEASIHKRGGARSSHLVSHSEPQVLALPVASIEAFVHDEAVGKSAGLLFSLVWLQVGAGWLLSARGAPQLGAEEAASCFQPRWRCHQLLLLLLPPPPLLLPPLLLPPSQQQQQACRPASRCCSLPAAPARPPQERLEAHGGKLFAD